MNIEKHVAYWRTTAAEELEVAGDLLEKKRARQSLFFCQLALEKYLKALVCLTIGDIPPRIHNLTRLSELAGLDLSSAERAFLDEMTGFNIEGRYPESIGDEPSQELAKNNYAEAKRICLWLSRK